MYDSDEPNRNGNGNGHKSGVVAAATRLGGDVVKALPSGFLSLVLLIAFMLYIIRDIQTERIMAMKEFALSCSEALMKSQPGR